MKQVVYNIALKMNLIHFQFVAHITASDQSVSRCVALKFPSECYQLPETSHELIFPLQIMVVRWLQTSF